MIVTVSVATLNTTATMGPCCAFRTSASIANAEHHARILDPLLKKVAARLDSFTVGLVFSNFRARRRSS